MKPSRRPSVFWQLFPAMLLTALFATVGVVHVASRVMVVRQGYSLSALESDRKNLEREHARLKLELATLKNPARLERIAREKLQMGPPSAARVLVLRGSNRAPATVSDAKSPRVMGHRPVGLLAERAP